MLFNSIFSNSAMFSSTFRSRNDLAMFWGRRQDNLTTREIWRNLSKLGDSWWHPESWQVCGFTATHSELLLITFFNRLSSKTFTDFSYISQLMLCYWVMPMNWNSVLWKIQLACFQKKSNFLLLNNRSPSIIFQNKL